MISAALNSFIFAQNKFAAFRHSLSRGLSCSRSLVVQQRNASRNQCWWKVKSRQRTFKFVKKRSSFQLIYAGAPHKSGKTSPVCHAAQVLEKIEDEIWATGEQPCEMLFIVFPLKSCSDLCENTTNSLALTQSHRLNTFWAENKGDHCFLRVYVKKLCRERQQFCVVRHRTADLENRFSWALSNHLPSYTTVLTSFAPNFKASVTSMQELHCVKHTLQASSPSLLFALSELTARLFEAVFTFLVSHTLTPITLWAKIGYRQVHSQNLLGTSV